MKKEEVDAVIKKFAEQNLLEVGDLAHVSEERWRQLVEPKFRERLKRKTDVSGTYESLYSFLRVSEGQFSSVGFFRHLDINFKTLQRVFPCDESMALMVDDRLDVWVKTPENVVKVYPCKSLFPLRNILRVPSNAVFLVYHFPSYKEVYNRNPQARVSVLLFVSWYIWAAC